MRGPGCVIRTLARVQFTQPSPHILFSCTIFLWVTVISGIHSLLLKQVSDTSIYENKFYLWPDKFGELRSLLSTPSEHASLAEILLRQQEKLGNRHPTSRRSLARDRGSFASVRPISGSVCFSSDYQLKSVQKGSRSETHSLGGQSQSLQIFNKTKVNRTEREKR